MKLRICLLTASIVLIFAAHCARGEEDGRAPIIVGYVFPRGAVLKPGQVDARNLDRINYAFANIREGRIEAASGDDAQNLALLVALKKENPAMQVLISVGGWLGSGDFSDIALTARSRKIFVDSAMEFLEANHLDGLDLDWEYPGQAGAGHRYRAVDKQNFTLLLEDLRERFAAGEKASGRRLYLTIAAGASDEYLADTEMAKVARAVDAVNLMAYDFNEGVSTGQTTHQAPLYTDPHAPISDSVDSAVRAFERAGVPAAKLILGVPFYGRSWQQVGSLNHGLFQPGKPAAQDFIPFAQINAGMIGHGFTRYWDASASAPYLYSDDKRIFISYDDPASLARKSSYVLAHRLGGVMFWEYLDDPGGTLLGTIARTLRAGTQTGPPSCGNPPCAPANPRM